MTRLPIRPTHIPTPTTTSPNDSVGVLFDALAPDYQRVRAEVGWDPWPHVEAALGTNPLTGWRILDIGCGDGEVAASLTSRHALVTGVDASPIMCEQARILVDQNATFFVYRLGDETQSLPQIAGDHFDATIALGCLEYVADQYDALTQLLSTVKPGWNRTVYRRTARPRPPRRQRPHRPPVRRLDAPPLVPLRSQSVGRQALGRR